jgi:hypothetical protein
MWRRRYSFASADAAFTAQLGAEGEAAQLLIASLHGNGVTSIEYIQIGRAVNIGGDSANALADYHAAVTAPPHNPAMAAAALRLAGALEYDFGPRHRRTYRYDGGGNGFQWPSTIYTEIQH